jgi:gas vesicle protein
MADQPADERSGGAGTVLLAFMLGAIAGAAVALLYAPAPGRETREFLGDKAKEAARKAKDAYAEATGEHA